MIGMTSQLRQLVDGSPEAVLILDSGGRIRHLNARALALFGGDSDRLLGESVRMVIPDQRLPLFAVDDFAGEGRTRPRLQLIARRIDASQFSAEVDVVPVASAHGLLRVVTVRDRTEARRAQLALERTVQVLFAFHRDRQLLLAHLVRVQEEERRRIAAGIHDDTVQAISGAHLRAQQLRNRLREPAEIAIVDKLDEAIQLSLDRLRQLIFDLRPSGLEDGSLTDALRTTLDALSSTTGIAVELDDELTTRVPPSTSLLVYRTVQEAVMNVRKHARATSVRVLLADLDNGYLVRVSDDGVGYDPAEVENRPGHLGLVLMLERPRIAGGWCRIESAPGAGTTVEFWVPRDPPGQPEPQA
jgi:PAS domain S-box-containing protein